MATRDAMVGGAQTGNPFAGGASPGAALAPQTQMGYTVTLSNGSTIMVNSEADYLKLKEWYGAQSSQSSATLGGGGGGGSGSGAAGMLDIAADGFQAVTGFLAGSNYNTKLQDFQDSRDRLLDTREALLAHRPSATDGPLVDLVLRAVDSQLDHIDSAISVLNTQITAVDMFAGGSAAKVISRFISPGGMMSGGGGGFGTIAAVGAAGLGLGLVLRNNNTTSRSRR